MKKIISFCFAVLLSMNISSSYAQQINHLWQTPPEASKSWLYWYWMYGAISKEGITADVEAMKQAGIGGAYIMPIKGVPEKPFINPSVKQLSPEWWEMVRFAMAEVDRVGIKIGFHVCDGFALAGGPWITPELSMQRVVWNTTQIEGGKTIKQELPLPENYEGYYKDIALFAYPTPSGEGISTETIKPVVTTSVADVNPQFLADVNSKETFRSEDPCWIQFAFDKPFTCRSIQIEASGNNFQAQRFTIQASNDGVNYRTVDKLVPPRQGWQNTGMSMTHAIPETTARYFRMAYDKAGTEPGAEDIDAAKWKQSLKIKHIRLSSDARIHQYEGKNASMWRLSPRTTTQQISDELCINKNNLIDISKYLDASGNLNWKAPKGNWTILRMGHTSTGHTNATGGAAAGLECDKFNPEAIRLQFNSWFGKAVEIAGEDLASRVLKVFHVDSWECGSQNWSPVFRDEFKARRGYDIYDYLPVMAGIPVDNVDTSERILYDVRKTISELVVDVFYKILKEEANAKGCDFSAECVSPTMMSDGMMHYKNTDIPMGEYWLQSPTHDKINDVLDAISGAHIYEKNIIQAEAFTQLRTMWDEDPAMVKTLQDRHYAMGINRISYHVYVHNPWIDRKPGMTLDGIGLYFQRDQTWWQLGRAWVDYAQRCHALLQYGKPVVDLAVFTGEELPRRAITPDRLVPFLPGLFGSEKVEKEQARMANVGGPTRIMPIGVTHSANITGASDWVNAMRGYMYDSFNPDILLNSIKVVDGRIVLPNGMSYGALVVPGKHQMQPNADYMSLEVMTKLITLVRDGATVMVDEIPQHTPGFLNNKKDQMQLEQMLGDRSLYQGSQKTWNIGKGKLIKLPYISETLTEIGIERDFIAIENSNYAKDIAYAHRQGDDVDIYFVSNQVNEKRNIEISLRANNRVPELWNPVNGAIHESDNWKIEGGRTILPISLDANESVFVVLQKEKSKSANEQLKYTEIKAVNITTPWTVLFDKEYRGPSEPITFKALTSWSENSDERIRYYSGMAVYTNTIEWKSINKDERYVIQLEEVGNLAEIKINGISCGTIWTKPYTVDITHALKKGNNTIEITVANTWANRIKGDEVHKSNIDSNVTWSNAPYRSGERPLTKSGLIGDVKIVTSKKTK